jgi:hypothetical protein
MSATDDLKHAAGDVNHAAGKVTHDAEVKGHELKEKAEDVAEDAKDKAIEVKEDVKENAQWAAERTQENAKAVAENAQHNAKVAADKISDAAARADPRELTPRSALDGLKNVDRTILRLNKYVARHIWTKTPANHVRPGFSRLQAVSQPSSPRSTTPSTSSHICNPSPSRSPPSLQESSHSSDPPATIPRSPRPR